MFEVIVKGDIASAHFLRNYEGKCKHLHGHTWLIEITIQREELNDIGMVEDFIVLKKQLKDFLVHIDHVCLNDLDYFKKVNPTTENIAKYIYQNFSKIIHPLRIKQVRVWESDSSSVVYYE